MKILIFGAGAVGMATGKGFLRLGHDVCFFDTSDKVQAELREHGYILANTGDMRFPVYEKYDVIFICVPEQVVEKVVAELVEYRVPGLKVIRSTVPIGTTKRLTEKYSVIVTTPSGQSRRVSFVMAPYRCDLCHNPEFLRESVADYEFMNPHRIVIGQCCKEHGDLLEELYTPLRAPIVRVDPTTSEMIKFASNAYLTAQISFWNEISKICQKINVNSHTVGKACALDPRISSYGASQHGEPYGGKCLPKDMEQLITFCESIDYDPELLKAVRYINNQMEKKEE